MTTLNCDMGESFGLYRIGDDAALMPLIDVEVSALRSLADYQQSALRLTLAYGERP